MLPWITAVDSMLAVRSSEAYVEGDVATAAGAANFFAQKIERRVPRFMTLALFWRGSLIVMRDWRSKRWFLWLGRSWKRSSMNQGSALS